MVSNLVRAQIDSIGETFDVIGTKHARIQTVTVNERQDLQAEVKWTNVGAVAGAVYIVVILENTSSGEQFGQYIHSSGGAPGESTTNFIVFELEKYRASGYDTRGTWNAIVLAGIVDESNGSVTDIHDEVTVENAVTIVAANYAVGNIDRISFLGL